MMRFWTVFLWAGLVDAMGFLTTINDSWQIIAAIKKNDVGWLEIVVRDRPKNSLQMPKEVDSKSIIEALLESKQPENFLEPLSKILPIAALACSDGETLLSKAVSKWYCYVPLITELIVTYGADVTASIKGESLVDRFLKTPTTHRTDLVYDKIAMQLFLWRGPRAIHYAASTGNYAEVLEIIKKNNLAVYECDQRGYTALFHALKYPEIAAELIKWGCTLKSENKSLAIQLRSMFCEAEREGSRPLSLLYDRMIESIMVCIEAFSKDVVSIVPQLIHGAACLDRRIVNALLTLNINALESLGENGKTPLAYAMLRFRENVKNSSWVFTERALHEREAIKELIVHGACTQNIDLSVIELSKTAQQDTAEQPFSLNTAYDFKVLPVSTDTKKRSMSGSRGGDTVAPLFKAHCTTDNSRSNSMSPGGFKQEL